MFGHQRCGLLCVSRFQRGENVYVFGVQSWRVPHRTPEPDPGLDPYLVELALQASQNLVATLPRQRRLEAQIQRAGRIALPLQLGPRLLQNRMCLG